VQYSDGDQGSINFIFASDADDIEIPLEPTAKKHNPLDNLLRECDHAEKPGGWCGRCKGRAPKKAAWDPVKKTYVHPPAYRAAVLALGEALTGKEWEGSEAWPDIEEAANGEPIYFGGGYTRVMFRDDKLRLLEIPEDKKDRWESALPQREALEKILSGPTEHVAAWRNRRAIRDDAAEPTPNPPGISYYVYCAGFETTGSWFKNYEAGVREFESLISEGYKEVVLEKRREDGRELDGFNRQILMESSEADEEVAEGMETSFSPLEPMEPTAR
jgi:hypothetical protein